MNSTTELLPHGQTVPAARGAGVKTFLKVSTEKHIRFKMTRKVHDAKGLCFAMNGAEGTGDAFDERRPNLLERLEQT